MIYIVGDSTVASFNEVYYYHRYGWGTMLYNYFKDDVKFINLAMSGRSSLSFTKENNYNIFKDNITKGDYVIIGFGHNDEKDDDPKRYTDPKGDINTKGSFKNSLYYNYIKVAEDKGAEAIICTPIARLDERNIYDGKFVHITNNGDYRESIVDLAKEVNIPCIDLTTYSKELNIKEGYELSCLRHAITKGMIKDEKLVPDLGTVDGTHINIYGAKVYSYYIAKTLKNSNSSIKNIIKDNLVEPTREHDLVMDKDYVYVPYKTPDFASYKAPKWFECDNDFVGTAFGDTGRGTFDDPNGYFAYKEADKFYVGQILKNNDKYTALGKISLNSEGYALVAKKISVTRNFHASVKARVIDCSKEFEQGFGLALRDDLYLGLKITDKTIKSNYVAASLLMSQSHLISNHSRENGVLVYSNNNLESTYQIGDTVTFSIERLGQVVTVKTLFKGKTYETTYTDFDFVKVDKDYFYLNLFAAKSIKIEFSDFTFVDDGISQGA